MANLEGHKKLLVAGVLVLCYGEMDGETIKIKKLHTPPEVLNFLRSGNNELGIWVCNVVSETDEVLSIRPSHKLIFMMREYDAVPRLYHNINLILSSFTVYEELQRSIKYTLFGKNMADIQRLVKGISDIESDSLRTTGYLIKRSVQDSLNIDENQIFFKAAIYYQLMKNNRQYFCPYAIDSTSLVTHLKNSQTTLILHWGFYDKSHPWCNSDAELSFLTMMTDNSYFSDQKIVSSDGVLYMFTPSEQTVIMNAPGYYKNFLKERSVKELFDIESVLNPSKNMYVTNLFHKFLVKEVLNQNTERITPANHYDGIVATHLLKDGIRCKEKHNNCTYFHETDNMPADLEQIVNGSIHWWVEKRGKWIGIRTDILQGCYKSIKTYLKEDKNEI